MVVLDLVFSSHASLQNFMVAKLGFSLRLEKAVSGIPPIGRRCELKSTLGTFAFYVKGRRASTPAGEITQQVERQSIAYRPRTPLKSKTNPLSDSPRQPTGHGDQSEEDQPNFQVLLVEDNLVNRRDPNYFPMASN